MKILKNILTFIVGVLLFRFMVILACVPPTCRANFDRILNQGGGPEALIAECEALADQTNNIQDGQAENITAPWPPIITALKPLRVVHYTRPHQMDIVLCSGFIHTRIVVALGETKESEIKCHVNGGKSKTFAPRVYLYKGGA